MRRWVSPSARLKASLEKIKFRFEEIQDLLRVKTNPTVSDEDPFIGEEPDLTIWVRGSDMPARPYHTPPGKVGIGGPQDGPDRSCRPGVAGFRGDLTVSDDISRLETP